MLQHDSICLGVNELNTTIDSLYTTQQKSIDAFSKSMLSRSHQNNLNLNYNIEQTIHLQKYQKILLIYSIKGKLFSCMI
jgi:biotin synthase-related radical SAM superfamily protein